MRERIPGISWAMMVYSGAMLAVPALAAEREIVGRWDIQLGESRAPCWLGAEWKDGKYAARFLQVGNGVFELTEFKSEGPAVEFRIRDNTWTGRIEGDSMTGIVVKQGKQAPWTAKRFVPKAKVGGVWTIAGRRDAALRLRQDGDRVTGMRVDGNGRPQRLSRVGLKGYALEFTQGNEQYAITVKGDVMEGTVNGAKFTARRERRWGEPIELFNGKDLDGWKPLGNLPDFKWKVIDGVMHCEGGTNNIVSTASFEDFRLHVEFKVPVEGNSGVYLRGRYEVQVTDSAGKTPDAYQCGGLYSRIAPSENVCKPAGEWQTYDITLVDHYLTVVQNGRTIIDNQEVEGITGGAIDSNEAEPGPIYLQGDHTAIDYRKVTIRPAGAAEAGGGRGGSATAR